jgi:outer membrane protein assembly factor BamB
MRTRLLILLAMCFISAGRTFSQVPGTKKWELATLGHVSSSPAIANDGTLYVGSGNASDTVNRGWLYSISPEGATNWALTFPQYVRSSPAIGADGRVFVGCWNGDLKIVRPNGEYTAVPTGGRVPSSPSIGIDDTIYVGSASNNFNKLFAFSSDGVSKWVFTMGRVASPDFPEQFSSPSIGPDGTIYVGSIDKKLYAIRPDGSTNWTFSLGAVTYASPAIGPDGTVYLGTDNGDFYALHPQGRLKWTFKTGHTIESSAAIGQDGTIYFGTLSGSFYALAPEGTKKWVFTAGGISASPAIGQDGTIYVGSYSTKSLHALSPAGTNVWTFVASDADGLFSSPVLGADGTIYFGAGKKLYAVYGTNALTSSSWPMFRGNAKHTARSIQRAIQPPFPLPDGNVSLTFTVEIGRTYQVEYSSDLAMWSMLTNFVSPSSTTQVVDTSATNATLRYYRLTTNLGM